MPQDHTGQGFDLDIGHRGPLRLGKIHHLFLGKADVGHVTLGHLGDDRRNLVIRQAVGRTVIAVKLHRQLMHRGIAARLDIRQSGGHNIPHLRVIFCFFCLGLAALEKFDRHCSYP